MDFKKNNNGVILITVLLLSVILVILIPVLTLIIRQEGRLTVKSTRASKAFHLAEAGADRGLWKIKENLDRWNSLLTGPIAGYNNDVTYTDVEGGTYKIKLSSSSNAEQRIITSTGRDSSSNEVRCVEIVVSRTTITSSVSAPTISFGGSSDVQWGPVASVGDLTMSTAYPRKMARGQIVGFDTSSVEPNDDIDGSGYWSWKSYYAVPDPPVIDVNYYHDAANVHEAGDYTPNVDVLPASADLIYYVHGNCTLQGDHLKGVLVVMGNLTMKGNGPRSYAVNIPAHALDQYQKCAGYPDPASMLGHPGPPTVITYSPTKIAFNGLIYVNGNFSATGTPTIYGCLIVNGSCGGTGNLSIFYNDDISATARTSSTSMTTVSWKEKPGRW